MAAVEGGALLLPEVLLLLGAGLRVAGAKLHPTTHAVHSSAPRSGSGKEKKSHRFIQTSWGRNKGDVGSSLVESNINVAIAYVYWVSKR